MEYALDLPIRAFPAILESIRRLKNRDRIEDVRITIAGRATNEYVEKLTQYYVAGSKSAEEIERSKPKPVATEDAFDALRQLLRR